MLDSAVMCASPGKPIVIPHGVGLQRSLALLLRR